MCAQLRILELLHSSTHKYYVFLPASVKIWKYFANNQLIDKLINSNLKQKSIQTSVLSLFKISFKFYTLLSPTSTKNVFMSLYYWQNR